MNARRAALSALIDIAEEGAYANLRLAELNRDISGKDRAFICAAVYTALDHLYYIDVCLITLAKRQKRVVRNLLRLAAAEILYMRTPARAAVNEYVSLSREVGKAASCDLVNAVLRRLAMMAERNELPSLPSEAVEGLSMEFSCPRWIISEWIKTFGINTTREILSSKQTGLTLRAQQPFTTKELFDALNAEACVCTHGEHVTDALHVERGFSLAAHPLFISGKMTAQGEGSMAACHALGALSGKRVLDACAAPGGKSAYLYSLAHGDIDLTAWELHPHRAELTQRTFERLKVRAKIECRDAGVFDAAYEGAFDAVLLDVPCTGFLSARDNYKTEADAKALAGLQHKILSVCSAYVKTGGILLYSTCTLSKIENGEQVRRFLMENPFFALHSERQTLPNNKTGAFYWARMLREK
jgi:16S rRNA (cytosine967-C5)-methyltransferase